MLYLCFVWSQVTCKPYRLMIPVLGWSTSERKKKSWDYLNFYICAFIKLHNFLMMLLLIIYFAGIDEC